MKFVVSLGDQSHPVDVVREDGRYRVTIDERVWVVDARLTAEGIASLLVEGVSYAVDVDDQAGACLVQVAGETYTVEVEEQTRHIIRTRGGAAGGGRAQTVKAPLPGRVTHVGVQAGDAVEPGQSLLVIEAMKMENELKAAAAGTVREVRVRPGQPVNAGDVLVVIG